MTIRRQLQRIIRKTDSTQTALAHTLGVSHVTMSRWIHGKATPRKAARVRIEALYQSVAGKRACAPQQSNVQVLLLVAGQSKRFWPLKEKPLFPICGRSLIEHQVNRLHCAGVSNVTAVGSKDNLQSITSVLPNLKVVEQKNASLGMRGALLSALPHLKDAPVMIVGGNDIIDPTGYEEALCKAKKSDGALLAQRVERYFPGGYISVKGNRIADIVEKPGEGNEPSDLVNLVVHVHNRPAVLLDALKEVDESRDDGYEQALAKLFSSHCYLAAPYTKQWRAIKYPWHVLGALDMLLQEIPSQSIHPSVQMHPSAVVDGAVSLGEGTRVFENAVIRGPCTVGRNCIIANNALVRSSSIGDHCVIGYNTEIKGSVLADNVWTHMNYIGDSVVGNNVSFGGGTITGNFRLDEKEIFSVVGEESLPTGLTKFGGVFGDNCRTGIHVSTNPGVKVGADTFVSTAALVSTDIPEKSFARMKGGQLTISENRGSSPSAKDRALLRKKMEIG